MSKHKTNEYAGVTRTDCCAGCTAEKCVISGDEFCHHPLKASHPMAGPDVVARVIEVKKILKHQAVERAA